jgi:hypothetical protein
MLGLAGCGGPSGEQAVVDAAQAAELLGLSLRGPAPQEVLQKHRAGFDEAAQRARASFGKDSQVSKDLAEIEVLLGELERGRDGAFFAMRPLVARLAAQYQSSGRR